ncbi:MAG: HAD family hydrolase [Oscillospiraceae bacterium]|nr:HAD family hydrolase [Oscillospiraceae bacterium]
MYKAILFDLDGTLLPLNMDSFIKGYFRELAKKLAPYGYEPEKLIKSIWKGTDAMTRNDGAVPNAKRFWDSFSADFGEVVYSHEPVFDDFYRNDFNAVIKDVMPAPETAARILAKARASAEKVVLATSPIFPLCGIETRLGWIGLKSSDFDYVTSYENSMFCKPNPKYFSEILSIIGVQPDDALMVGNDVDEDIIPAQRAGLSAYLVTDCAINKSSSEITSPSGTYEELISFL